MGNKFGEGLDGFSEVHAHRKTTVCPLGCVRTPVEAELRDIIIIIIYYYTNNRLDISIAPCLWLTALHK